MDLTASCFLVDGTECKIVTGVDDDSRYCVIATVVPRGSGRAVCLAFVRALLAFGCPDEVLIDNGKQFTGRFTRPHSCGTGSAGQAPSCPRAVRPAPQRRAAVLVRRPVYSVLVGRAVSALRSARSAVDPAGSVLVRARGPGEDRSVRPS